MRESCLCISISDFHIRKTERRYRRNAVASLSLKGSLSKSIRSLLLNVSRRAEIAGWPVYFLGLCPACALMTDPCARKESLQGLLAEEMIFKVS